MNTSFKPSLALRCSPLAPESWRGECDEKTLARYVINLSLCCCRPTQPNRFYKQGAPALTSAKPAPLNRLRQLWREGRPTFGAIATIPSIQTV
jgi:hypothetical protein